MSVVTKQPFNFEGSRLYMAAGAWKRISFPPTKVSKIRFRESGVEVQNTGSSVAYLRLYATNGNKSAGQSGSVMLGPWPDKKNLNDVGNMHVDSMVDSLVVIASQRLTLYFEEDSSFEIITELPSANLKATDITSSSMSISWDGTEFSGATFKVVLSSEEETKEYTTNESHINPLGLSGDTSYVVSLYVEK